VQDVCTLGLNLFRVLMIYLKPILPATAKQVEHFLNIAPLQWQDKNQALLNHTIREFQPLITRVDPKQIEAIKMASQTDLQETEQTNAAPKKQFISIDDFNKIDLRVAKIIEASAVEGADKLLQLTVELDNEKRQIFAGIKSAYQPESLIGRHVVVVANLEPRKMRFGMSEGMVLAASHPGSKDLWLVSPDVGAPAGAKVK